MTLDPGAEQPTVPREPAHGPASDPASDPVVRVLIVDDHEMVRWGLTAMLERHPRLQVVGAATDGAEVVDAVARLDPDVVVMDISMPGVDGITATRSVRGCRPDVPVILISVEVDPPRHAAGLVAGAAACLSKTTLTEDLVPAILAAADAAA